MSERICLFIGHVPEDERARNALVKHLDALQRSGRVHIWDGSRAAVGKDLDAEMDGSLSVAGVAVLLLSRDYLSSETCWDREIPAILRRHREEGLQLFPILVGAYDYAGVPWLAGLQCFPREGPPIAARSRAEQDLAWASVAAEVRARLPGITAVAAEALPDTRWLSPAGPVPVDLGRLPVTDRRLHGRARDLERLDAAWADSKTHVLSIVAWGGVGKSALVNGWLAAMQEAGWRGAEQVLGWSFVNQGTRQRSAAADVFIDVALRRLGDPAASEGSPWEKGRRLANLVSSRRTLLVLDGLEALLEPPGPREGAIRDPAMQSLLRGLAMQSSGLCIVTTRFAIKDLAPCGERSAPTYQLAHLARDAGVALLRAAGVKGTEAELAAAVDEYDGHCLALTLLGSFLSDVANGDIRRRAEIPPLHTDDRHGQDARSIMASYDRWLSRGGAAERAILRLVGLFDGAADGPGIAALLAEPPIAGLTSELSRLPREAFRTKVARLRRAGLLLAPSADDPEALDAHPLVREYFGALLRARAPRADRSGHARLFEHLQQATPEQPETIEEMEPLYGATIHGCRAGRPGEALESVVKRRIHRGTRFFNGSELGAFGAELRALLGFFVAPWDRLIPGLTAEQEAFVLREASYCLRAVGRPRDGIEPMQRALAIDLRREDWLAAAIDTNNLGQVHLVCGDLRAALRRARESVEHADRSGEVLRRIGNRTAVAEILHQLGDTGAAEALFLEAEGLETAHRAGSASPRFQWGHRHCELLLTLGRVDQVRHRIAAMLERDELAGRRFEVAVDQLVLAQTLLAGGSATPDDSIRAIALLDEAVDALRQGKMADFLVRGLLVRASTRLSLGLHDACSADLGDALAMATDASMQLFEADALILHCRLSLACARLDVAREHLSRARSLVRSCGYGRRAAAIEELGGQLR